MRTCAKIICLSAVVLFLPLGGVSQSTPAARDWLTWGYDPERTGWNKGETTLSRDNVSRLELKWNTQLSTKPTEIVLSTLTAPLVIDGVNTAQGRKTLVFIVGSDDTVFAIDADNGKVVWHLNYSHGSALAATSADSFGLPSMRLRVTS